MARTISSSVSLQCNLQRILMLDNAEPYRAGLYDGEVVSLLHHVGRYLVVRDMQVRLSAENQFDKPGRFEIGTLGE